MKRKEKPINLDFKEFKDDDDDDFNLRNGESQGGDSDQESEDDQMGDVDVEAEKLKIIEANMIQQDERGEANMERSNGTLRFALEVEDEDEEVKVSGDQSIGSARNT